MIAFLRGPAGRWAVRFLALVIGWLVATRVLGMQWQGHTFLLAMTLCVALGLGYAIDQIVALLLDITKPKPQPGRQVFEGAIPQLSAAKQKQVRRLHKLLAEAGVFAPDVPDAELAFAHFAVTKGKVTWLALLGAYENADRYHPECDPSRWAENLTYDHIPQAWLTPAAGKVAAFLWEDDSMAFSLVEEASMSELEKEEGSGPGWGELTDEMIALFEQAKVFVH